MSTKPIKFITLHCRWCDNALPPVLTYREAEEIAVRHQWTRDEISGSWFCLTCSIFGEYCRGLPQPYTHVKPPKRYDYRFECTVCGAARVGGCTAVRCKVCGGALAKLGKDTIYDTL